MGEKQDLGASAVPTGLSQAEPAGLGPTGFDPSREEPYDFEDLCAHVTRAIRFAYTITRKNRGRSIPWKGPGLGRDMRANSPEFGERLRAGNLRYAEEDQGRDALDEIVGVALQLGIEQGRRIAANGPEAKTLRIKLSVANLGLERLGSMQAFDLSRMVDPERDVELLARIEYARNVAEVVR